MSTDPHLASDDSAILAAHDRRLQTARDRFRRVCAEFFDKPDPWGAKSVVTVTDSLLTEHIASLRRENDMLRGMVAKLEEARDA